MPNKRCVYACHTIYQKEKNKIPSELNKISVYRFPSDNVEPEKWIKAIPNSNLVVTKYTVICELRWPPNFDTVIVRGGKRRPKNPPSIWLGITLSQIPTANPTERTTKRSLSGIRSTLDDELDTFLTRDKANFCDIKNKFINSSDH